MSESYQIDLNNIPEHIAIIMDGNGRWAKKHLMDRTFGHTQGVDAVRKTVEACVELGVKHLTLYAFSTENWNRPSYEIEALMNLLVTSLNKELNTFIKNGVRLHTIGDVKELPEKCQKELTETIEKTQKGDRLQLNLALSYSSRWEIINAINSIVEEVREGKINETITESIFEHFLATKGLPDPDLLIRTSGEYRISNFLLWQIAYCELYFSKLLWPEFDRDELLNAIIDYQKRERRFGKTSEQIN